MHSFKETKLMQHDAELLSEIVMDIEKYSEFLPWCSSAVILSKEDNLIVAKLEISFEGFAESYISRVAKEQIDNNYLITTEAISGPFRYLKNSWHIKQLQNGSEINFSIDFEFKSTILDLLIGLIFSVATKKMIAAFEDRANRLSQR
ncbi:MAG: type II toxin-antitoxin system RatA family toxin [Rickettsiaceae bacterium]|jgi:coenzyme Q-binding protein COQ10|nr:type II toxin-antitoxin system RatA family toxin [Rickettsiaceae bacterium]